MAEKLTKTQLKKMLSTMPQEDMIRLIVELYTTSPVIKNLLNMKLNPKADIADITDQYEKKLQNIVGNPYRFSLQAVKMVVKEAKEQYGKVSPIYSEVALSAAEWLNWFTESYGDIDNSLYTCLDQYYRIASDAAKQHEELRAEFAPRLCKLNEAFRGMGWGMCDTADEEWD